MIAEHLVLADVLAFIDESADLAAIEQIRDRSWDRRKSLVIKKAKKDRSKKRKKLKKLIGGTKKVIITTGAFSGLLALVKAVGAKWVTVEVTGNTRYWYKFEADDMDTSWDAERKADLLERGESAKRLQALLGGV